MDIVIDTATMFTIASDLFNSFWPIIGLVSGFALGFALVKFVGNAIKNALPG